MATVTRSEYQFELPFPREQVWPVLSKTDWLNRSLGLPPVEYDIKPRPEGGSQVKARTSFLGQQLEWIEHPFEWLEPEFHRVHRVFSAGPFAEGWTGVTLRQRVEGSTQIVVFSEWVPRGRFGGFLAARVVGPRTRQAMKGVIAHIFDHLRGQQSAPLPKLPVHPVRETPLKTGLEKLTAGAGGRGELVSALEKLMREAPDVEISRLRPFAVARSWGRDPWEVLRLFLHATRAGLLDLRWEILCPNCRSSRQPLVTSLSQLPRTTHCDVCQIRYDAEFDKSVELLFMVNAAIRPTESRTYCLAGPGGTPHVLSQCCLEAGQRRAWKLPDLVEPLRLRSPQVKRPVTIRPEEGPTPLMQPVILCEPEQFTVRQEYGKVQDYAVQVLNPNNYPIQLAIERLDWSSDILTAARVTNWQEFRDLFAQEVISPDEQITVGSQVVLFTDLRGSTAMYHGLGDAPAYVVVRKHFTVLTNAIRANHGTVVKTIGDAVMAVFSRVDEALAAVRFMHQRLHEANPDPSLAARLFLKSGLHVGPCLAVNANEKLDFFGTTVNLAARMVGCCKGGDLTVSDELFQRPETAQFLQSCPQPPEAAEVRFRGFEVPQKVWRVQIVT